MMWVRVEQIAAMVGLLTLTLTFYAGLIFMGSFF